MSIFNAKIVEGGKENVTFSATYLEDLETRSVVAVPVEIKEGAINLLEVNGDYPKMFK